MTERRYVKPSWGDRLFNGAVALLAGLGVSLYGSRILAVRGRRSGEWRTVPVNLLAHDGARYLIAPRGETEWVRNLRARGGGELRLGRRSEPFRGVELSDAEKPALLRAYLERWGFEVGRFFPGVDAGSPDADLLRVAAGYPAFRIEQP